MTEEKRHELKISGSNFEFTSSGDLDYLNEKLDEIIEFVKHLEELLGADFGIDIEAPTETEISEAPTEEIPVIKVQRSTQSNIQSLFETDWGKTPRSLAEVTKALEINAVPDKASSISIYLRRLVRKGVLRRLQRDGRYHYIKIPDEE